MLNQLAGRSAGTWQQFAATIRAGVRQFGFSAYDTKGTFEGADTRLG